MASTNLSIDHRYGTWAAWNSWVTYHQSNNGDANRFYIGGDTGYRMVFRFKVPSLSKYKASKKLVIAWLPDDDFTPKYVRAFLSTSSYGDSADTANWSASSMLGVSYAYFDANKTVKASYKPVEQAQTVYFVFNTTALKANTTYYVYVAPYATDYGEDTSNVVNNSGSGSWMRGRNMDGYLTCSLEYTTLATYSVTYNANGGSGAPSSQTKTEGVSLKLSSSKPNRGSTTANGYKVDFNSNGGTSIPSSLTQKVTISYTFLHWNTRPDGSGTSYNPGGTYSANASVTLYAIWKKTVTRGSVKLPPAITRNPGLTSGYWVTYNANGGLGAPDKTLSDMRSASYTFSKWAEGSPSGTKYDANATYTPSGNTTMFATWNTIANPDSRYLVPSTIPTKSGSRFLGWDDSPSATTAKYLPGRGYVIQSDLTLYAVWTSAGSVRISDGNAFGNYSVYISNGVAFEQYTPYISNGNAWEIYT